MRGTLQGTTYIKKEKESQKLRMGGGSWSINLEELPSGTRIIEYITPFCRYTISTEDAFMHGFTKFLGGERKLVVPIKCWTVTEELKNQAVRF